MTYISIIEFSRTTFPITVTVAGPRIYSYYTTIKGCGVHLNSITTKVYVTPVMQVIFVINPP